MNNEAVNIQQEIRKHLTKTKMELNNHLSNKEERFLFKLALQTPERQEKAKKILTWIDQTLGDKGQRNKETLDEDKEVDQSQKELKAYKTLFNNWNENKKEYDGSLDLGGRLLTLKEFLDKWENPPKPALTAEQQAKLDNYDNLEKERDKYKGERDTLQDEQKAHHEQLDKLEKKIRELEKENKRLSERQLSENEKQIMVAFRTTIPSSVGLSIRREVVDRILAALEKNDLTVQATPNLSAENISLPQRLAEAFKQFIWVCDFYLDMSNELNQEIEDLEKKIDELENK